MADQKPLEMLQEIPLKKQPRGAGAEAELARCKCLIHFHGRPRNVTIS